MRVPLKTDLDFSGSQVRYYHYFFAQKLLFRTVLENPLKAFLIFKDQENSHEFLQGLWELVLADNSDNQEIEAKFKVRNIEVGKFESIVVIKIVKPLARATTESYFIGMYFNLQYKEFRYFTLEKSLETNAFCEIREEIHCLLSFFDGIDEDKFVRRIKEVVYGK